MNQYEIKHYNIDNIIGDNYIIYKIKSDHDIIIKICNISGAEVYNINTSDNYMKLKNCIRLDDFINSDDNITLIPINDLTK